MKQQSLLFLIFHAARLTAQTQTGKASLYSDAFEGKPPSSGEKYRAKKVTTAPKTLPFGAIVKVTNLVNDESVKGTSNDRGPKKEGRVIALSRDVAARLKFIDHGTAELGSFFFPGQSRTFCWAAEKTIS